jgi:hypothetical protein
MESKFGSRQRGRRHTWQSRTQMIIKLKCTLKSVSGVPPRLRPTPTQSGSINGRNAAIDYHGRATFELICCLTILRNDRLAASSVFLFQAESTPYSAQGNGADQETTPPMSTFCLASQDKGQPEITYQECAQSR